MWLAAKSIADRYNDIVNECLVSDKSFSTFKSNSSYNQIVGMSNGWQGDVWLKDILTNHREILPLLPKLLKNDELGTPTDWVYEENISISPNTARYINSALQIIKHFKFDKPINVVELGIGYGGLCYIFNCLIEVKTYGLIDLPNVQQFAKKYLNKLDLANISLTPPEDNDLFISEFCLSEFDDDDLYNFYNRYLLNSKHIFLQMNLHEENRKTKFLQRIQTDFDCIIRDEFPKTHWPNYTVLGTKK